MEDEMAKTTIRGYRETPVNVAASNSTWIIAQGALLNTESYGIHENAESHDNTYIVKGTITTPSNYPSLYLQGSSVKVLIAETGEISSDIRMEGVGATLDNYNEILGRVWVRNKIVNHEGARIEDERGGAVAILQSLAGEHSKLVNHGVIRYLGEVSASVAGGYGDDTIVNRGKLGGHVTMGSGDDRFVGTGGSVKGGLDGGNGDDTIVLHGMRMTAHAHYGSDILGQHGNDTIKLTNAKLADSTAVAGGVGHDTFIIDNAEYQIREFAGEHEDTVKTSVTYEIPANVEILILTGKRNISALGGESSDDLRGNSGDNILRGRGSFDDLNGGRGNDRLFGGTGGDVFAFRTGHGKDVIEDFTQAEFDVVSLSDWKAIKDFSDLISNHASNHGDDVWLTAGSDRLIIRNMQKNELQEGDFFIM